MRETRVFAVLVGLTAGALLSVAAPGSAATDTKTDSATDTTTTLTSSANPSTAGQAITLTATVAGASPTGQVAFAETGSTLGTVDLNAGVATLVVSSLGVGAHTLTATYTGDAYNNASSAVLTQTVAAPPVPRPRISLAVSSTKVSVGDKVRLRWRSKHADSVTASGDWNGTRKARGTAEVRITERGKHVFKLTAHNAAGDRTARVEVTAIRKAKVLELVVTDELTMVGSDVDVTADGLAKGEPYTIRLNGKPILTGKADSKGDVARTFTLAKTLPEGALPITITGSNPGRLGAGILNVIKPKTLEIELSTDPVQKKQNQAITVTGLASGETVTVMYAGTKLTTGHADEAGMFTYAFNVGRSTGKHTVKVTGAAPSRVGTATFTVTAGDPTGL